MIIIFVKPETKLVFLFDMKKKHLELISNFFTVKNNWQKVQVKIKL